jgi:threonine/homoserine/homoserine lactone efflux protein
MTKPQPSPANARARVAAPAAKHARPVAHDPDGDLAIGAFGAVMAAGAGITVLADLLTGAVGALVLGGGSYLLAAAVVCTRRAGHGPADAESATPAGKRVARRPAGRPIRPAVAIDALG